MRKFSVTAALPVYITVIVDAESGGDAIDKAFEQFYLSAYAGNGGYNKLVGVSESNVSIEAGEYLIKAEGYEISVTELENEQPKGGE